MTSVQDSTAPVFEFTYFSSIKTAQGTRRKGTLQDLAALHAETAKPTKMELPLISLVTYASDSRAASSLPEAFTGLVLDYDDGTVTLRQLKRDLKDLNLHAFIHETASSTKAKFKCHVLLPFSRPLKDTAKVWAWILQHLPPPTQESHTPKQAWFIGHLLTQVATGLLFNGWPVDTLGKTLELSGFNLKARLADVLETGDGTYAFLRDYAMSLANSGKSEDAIRETLNDCEAANFPGYLESLSRDKYASVERAIRGALKKSSQVVDLRTRKELQPPPETPPENDWQLIFDTDLVDKPKVPKAIIEGWLPDNAVTLLAGDGGTGKSFALCYIASRLANGQPVLGSTPKPQRVLYVHCEDETSRVNDRLNKYLHQRKGNLVLLDGTSTNNILFAQGPMGMPVITQRYLQLKEACAEIDVLIIDGSADVYGCNENDRSSVKTFVNLLSGLCPCVILAAHVNKTAAKEGSSNIAYSGSTAWNNSVRSRWALQFDEAGVRKLEVQKSNYSAIGHYVTLEWNDKTNVMDFSELKRAERPNTDKHLLMVLHALAEIENPTTSTAGASSILTCLQIPDVKKFTKKTWEPMLAALLSSGLIELQDREATGRNKPPTTKNILLTDAGRKALQGKM